MSAGKTGSTSYTELPEDLLGPDINACNHDNRDGHLRASSNGVPSFTYLLVKETVENSHQQTLGRESVGRGRHPGPQGWGMLKTHLEGTEEQLKEELGGAQTALGMLISHKGKDHLMDAQQRDEGQRGPGQPAGTELESPHLPGLLGFPPQRQWPPSPPLSSLDPGPCPPELVVSIVHLTGTQLGHKKTNDADKDEKIDLCEEDKRQGQPENFLWPAWPSYVPVIGEAADR